MKTLREMMDIIESAQTVEEAKLTPEQSAELKGYIDAYRDATDPEGYYDIDSDDNPDPDEILGTIAGKFGQHIADTVANGPSMHFPRDNHSMDSNWYDIHNTAPRVSKSGKVNRQDVDVLKRNLKTRAGDFTKPNLPEEQELEETELDPIRRVEELFKDKR